MYKGHSVLELTNPLIPIRTVREVRDKFDYKFSQEDYDKIICEQFEHVAACDGQKHLLRTYRQDTIQNGNTLHNYIAIDFYNLHIYSYPQTRHSS
jgi:hypothetical protein